MNGCIAVVASFFHRTLEHTIARVRDDSMVHACENHLTIAVEKIAATIIDYESAVCGC